jgi:hypothetical protein
MTQIFNEDNRALTPRTIENDFGDIVNRPSVQNDPALVEQSLTLLETKGAGDKMDKRRTSQLIRAGKFPDETLSELIALWK